ncbi:MAG: phosphatase PAP2 family protein [Candidatus Liptonbacteria bacterium]|nr:phosphatase PAP2 family protein [Candidatus Liptonbacteria bacterium]
MDLNQQLFDFLFQFTHKSGLLDGLFVFFAKYLTYLLVTAILIWLFGKAGRKLIFIFSELAISAILSRGLIAEWIRFFYYNPRPFEALGFTSLVSESSASFPSGHMTFLFALGTVIFFYNKKFGGWFLGLSFIVGIARIFAGVHWPYDIAGGIVIGALCGFIVHKILYPYWVKLELGPNVVKVGEIEVDADGTMTEIPNPQ